MTSPAERVEAMLGPRGNLTTPREPRPWLRGAHRILRPGLKALWFGPRGSLKSMAALILAVQIIEAGGHVTYLDFENGEQRMGRRLRTILADREPELKVALEERFDYRPHVRLARMSVQEREAWASAFGDDDLVILDGLARALSQLDLDENSNADVATFMVGWMDPIAALDVATLALDNTGHAEQERPRAASAKLDLMELAYRFALNGTISEERHGTITFTRTRTRDGDEASTLEVEAGGGSYGRVQSALPSDVEQARDEAMIRWVAEHPGADIKEVAKGVGVRLSSVRTRGSRLRERGRLQTRRSRRPDRNGTPHTYTGWYPAGWALFGDPAWERGGSRAP